jgi:hypothetical protein
MRLVEWMKEKLNRLSPPKDRRQVELDKMFTWYASHQQNGKKPSKMRVLEYLQEHPEKEWWWAWEVVNKRNKSGDFLSHRACARLTDLAEDGICEKVDIGKYTAYRLIK